MSENAIFLPLLTQVGIFFLLGFILLGARVKAVKQRQISPEYFKVNQGGEVPEHLLRFGNHYNNQFAVPVLFYVLCISAYVLNAVDEVMVYLAWGFVLIRLAHSFIHLTYNNVLHRMMAFLLALLIAIIMWVKLLGAVLG